MMRRMRCSSVTSSEMSMAEAATFVRGIGSKWRDDASAARCVEELAIFHRVMDLKGWLWASTDSVDNTFFFNNQTSFAMSKIAFGKGSFLGFHPWHSHQHLQVVEASAGHWFVGPSQHVIV